jgi:hypothetical protein
MMNRMAWLSTLVLLVPLAQADTLTLKDGRVVKGQLSGYAARKFEFKAEDGAIYSEYALDIKSIVAEAPLKVSVKLASKQYDAVEFVGFDSFTLRLRKNGQPLNEPVVSLSSMELAPPPASNPVEPAVDQAAINEAVGGASPGDVGAESGEDESRSREWKRTGKWREMEEDKTSVISNGEEVDIEASLKKGYVNIVQFHYRKSLASVREGNYIDAVAARKSNRVVVRKIVVSDFNAPVCKALNIQAFPQFWFYNDQGKLVKKLTDRFTEGDIDAAIKAARRR